MSARFICRVKWSVRKHIGIFRWMQALVELIGKYETNATLEMSHGDKHLGAMDSGHYRETEEVQRPVYGII